MPNGIVMSDKSINTLVDRKLRFTFDDGPMAGKSFDHVFHKDGSVEFGAPGAATTTSKDAALVKVADGFFLASYLGPKGYTLTIGIDAEGGKLVAFSSDGKQWSKQVGSFAIIGD